MAISSCLLACLLANSARICVSVRSSSSADEWPSAAVVLTEYMDAASSSLSACAMKRAEMDSVTLPVPAARGAAAWPLPC